MQVAIVEVHAAETVMVAILFINRGGFGEFGEGFLTDLFKAITILRLARTGAGAAARDSFASAGDIGIDFSAELQGNQPLDGSHVVERSGHIAVLGIAFFVLGDGGGEALDGVLVASLAAGDASV